MTTPALLPIGKLAAATGVAVSALRHYDDVGVIAPAGRVGGKRRFSADAVGRVNFVRRAQRVGFSLAEIRHILDNTSSEAHQIVADKIQALRAQQIELATMIAMLEEIQGCGCELIAECPAIAEPC